MFHNKLNKRWGVRLIPALVLVIALMLGVAGIALATLSGGSTFESGDGNLVVNTTGLHDWNSPVETITCPSAPPGSGTNCGLDLVKNAADNSLGQGSKEDDLSPTIVSGSIPPSKDDLSRFYINHEKVGGNDFLYLAWERSNLLGSAHMDFELNQVQVGITTTTSGPVTLNRTQGDLLIDFDFGGSGVPVLAKHTWLTDTTKYTATTACEVSNTLPCWSKAVTLTAPLVEAAVNNVPVTDTNPPGAPFTLDGNTKNGINSTFGEAGINLTGSGIFPTNVCEHFGDAWLKSRSSGNSFGSELKDFIAPIPINISNCGSIIIRKQTNPDGAPGTFSFTHDVDGNSTPVVPSPFTLSDNGEQDFFSVLAGTYHFTEAATTGFDFSSISCTVTGSGGSTFSSSGPALTITLKVGDTVDCTFNNTQRGTIIVKKVTDPNPDPSNTSFGFTAGGGLSPASFSLTNGGMQTYPNVVPGSGYSVAENVPAGWDLTSATCDDGSPVSNISVSPGETVTCTFNDRSRGAIKILKESTKTGHPLVLNAGAVFSYDSSSVTDNGSGDENSTIGVVCVSNLIPGSYSVSETSAPSGYARDTSTLTAVAVAGTNCTTNPPSGTGVATFLDPPLSDIQVNFRDGGSGETSATITCDNTTGTGDNTAATGWDTSRTVTGVNAPTTIHCTIVIDP